MRELDTYIDGVFAGTVWMTSSGALGFRYADAYLRSPDPTPLSMSMPLERLEHRNRVVLPFLQGLLPDNPLALASMATTFGVSAASPFALLEHVGLDVAGALQFVPAGEEAPDAAARQGDVDPVTDLEVAGLLRDAVEEYRVGHPLSLREGRFSLAGAQPKIALHRLAGSWGIPRDATPTTHILKPSTGELSRIDVIEQLTMGAAAELGLPTASSELVDFGGLHTFVTTRYDRVERGGRWRRLHQEDLCQALSVPPSKKYQRREGGPGVGAIAGLLEAIPSLEDRRATARSFFAGFVFNAVVAGTDAHAKNYSVMLDGDRVGLAPLYDLASYAAYRSSGEGVHLAMSANGKYALDTIGTDDLVKTGMRLSLRAAQCRELVDEIRTGALGAFQRARAAFAATGADGEEIADRLLDGVAALPLVTPGR